MELNISVFNSIEHVICDLPGYKISTLGVTKDVSEELPASI
jgi:hypothetical protein